MDLRAILVCVDYADFLEITLPWNRKHFSEILVVTSRNDQRTSDTAHRYASAEVFYTDAFYENGAHFNKWRALEEGLDFRGRKGWICIMDPDILWPRGLDLDSMTFEKGKLYTPLCRIMKDLSQPIPSEEHWDQFPLRPNQTEWAGYSQIFHADDPVLGEPPWHETDWTHAGGADSFFQRKWPKECKVRPGFEALHLGPHGVNWHGRVSPFLDGSTHPDADQRRAWQREMYLSRKRTRSFDSERVKEQDPCE